MSETAPLTSAHNHARRAAEETLHIHWTNAAEEHRNAATEYSRATRATSDSEALRVLRLLEEQHQRLARIISAQDAAQLSEAVSETDNQSSIQAPTKDAQKSSAITDSASSKAVPQPTGPSPASARLDARARDSSPSLARDIASRRGIPPPGRPHVLSAVQARARQLSPESQRRAKAGPAPKIPASVMDSQTQLQRAASAKRAQDDEGFANFYNNLTTGTMSKLSSVLAYAGLPLASDDAQSQSATLSRPAKRTVNANADHDVKKLFSKAALDAIQDDHSQRGMQGHVFGPTESFYVVQAGGGTLSYADIAKAQHQQQSVILEGDDEDAFVDAREAQPASPRHSRTSSKPQRSNFGNPRTGEELELENTTLKQTLEQLASRLANFEVHAQDASMAALTQSVASLRHTGPASDHTSQDKIKALERQIEQQAEQREKLEDLARKQEKKIRAYHSKWEDIKKSAKEKERAKREKHKGQDDDEGLEEPS